MLPVSTSCPHRIVAARSFSDRRAVFSKTSTSYSCIHKRFSSKSRSPFKTYATNEKGDSTGSSTDTTTTTTSPSPSPSSSPSPDPSPSEGSDETRRELGPFLQSFGIESDPNDFIADVFVLASCFDIIIVGMTFWGVQHYGGGSLNEAARAAGGLGLGLLTRPLLETEYIFMPLYMDFIEAITSTPVVEATPVTQENVSSIINKVGGLLFVAFLVSQALLHLTAGEAAQIVVPMAAGWLVFDLAVIVALLVKLRLI